ncbi:class I SAM-dependent DNA methyltransferase [Coraliomargarita algicola]
MSNDPSQNIVSKVWNYAHVLKNAGVGYGDYVEQITYLLFLKLAEEREELGYDNPIPDDYQWPQLTQRSGDDLEVHYRHTLESLGKEAGLVGVIFRKAQNKISNPSDLERVIKMIDDEDWSAMDVDIKGAIYEGLLEKTASSSDKGAGQYFTPRPLIRAIVDVMQPKPMQTIADPASGTGGFLLAAHDYIVKHHKLDKDEKKHLKTKALHGTDIVDSVTRLCAMNLYLHGIGSAEGKPPVESRDALASPPTDKVDMILANPPFGKKGGYTIVGDDGKVSTEKHSYERDDFWATTSNKQLNFLQHIVSMLNINGSAAVVLPDNVLFEGGAGETIRRNLLQRCDLHTILRLPTGLFYAQGVKANVLFFDRKPASEKPWTKNLWIYDLRTNLHFTLKTNPLSPKDLADFVKCYKSRSGVPPLSTGTKRQDATSTVETERFKKFTYEEVIARDKANLDIFWLKDDTLEDSENLPAPAILAAEIVESLQTALEEFQGVEESLQSAES